MPDVNLTDAQRCLLLVICHHPDRSWLEVDAEYFKRRPVPGGWHRPEPPTARIVANALRRKGLIYEHGGPELTQAGRDVLMYGRLDWLPDGRVR